MKEKRYRNAIIEYMESFGFALAIVVILFSFFLRIHTVAGSSMDTTLAEGDRIIVLCFGGIERGDIVVVDGYSHYGQPLVKRVIGMEGDVIDVDMTGHVIVNGQPIEEPYVTTPTTANGGIEFPVTVEEGKVFLMGDNRIISKDSRSPEVGQIDYRDIYGKAVFRVLPFSSMGSLT